MIRWGILAPGRIAHKFAKDLATVGNAKLVAVGSRNKARAEAFVTEYGAKYAFGSYEELAQCSEIDVIYIASPHVGHYEHTLLCLKHKKAVLCEKPFAMNTAQVQEMLSTAEANGVFLMEALWSRFMPWAAKLQEILATTKQVHLLKADFGFEAVYNPEARLYNKALGGGAWLDIGIYPAFLSYLIFGKPQTIKALANFSDTDIDKTISASFTYKNGGMAILDSTLLAETPSEAVIYTDTCRIKIHGRWHESKGLTVAYKDGKIETFDFPRPTFGYDYEIRAVNECLEKGLTQCPQWNWQDSLNLIEILDAVRQEIGLHYEN